MSSITKQATVEDAESSPSPSSPPKVPLPSTSVEGANEEDENADDTDDQTAPVDQPIESLGGDDEDEDEDEDEEWDPSVETLPGQVGSSKGKGKGKDEVEGTKQEGGEEQPWQAVWAPEQNAWYFWNTKTSEVSWTNPLQTPESTSDGASSSTQAPLQPPLPNEAPPLPSVPIATPTASYLPNAFESAPSSSSGNPYHPEIDEGLLHIVGGSRAGAGFDPSMQSASFNARTGRFTPQDYQYTVGHLDEYNRAKRMNSHYFDVDAWEKERAADNEKRKREEESGAGSNKKTTKKDMQRFRQKAQEKKARSQAWLRE